MATKTTFVVFKQHDPQSVAELSGVARDPLTAPKSTQTQKNDVLRGFSVENSSPSTIWGVWCCQNFYFLKQQQKLLLFCKKFFFLSLTHKKLQSTTKKLPNQCLLDFLASIHICLLNVNVVKAQKFQFSESRNVEQTAIITKLC